MPDLKLVANFDLPRLWDGARVDWETEQKPAAVFLCPPPKERERCSECGSQDDRQLWRGLRHPRPGEMADSTRTVTGRFGRTVHLPTKVPAWAVYDLVAFRCTHCAHDQVWDMRSDEWWDLEPEDYGPRGSVRPNPVSEPISAHPTLY